MIGKGTAKSSIESEKRKSGNVHAILSTSQEFLLQKDIKKCSYKFKGLNLFGLIITTRKLMENGTTTIQLEKEGKGNEWERNCERKI